MIDHVTIRVSELEASKRFYDTVLPTLGLEIHSSSFGHEWGDFSLSQATPEKQVTRRLHVGFRAPSREHVDAFWRAGIDAGYVDDGEPGPRPQYSPSYYGGFLLDPDGNSAEAVSHDEPRASIDHVWIRVSDVEASKRFYDAVSAQTGFPLHHEREQQATFVGSGGSFTVVAGEPTENLHMAFSAEENETVDAFHRAALDAGYRDNGAPGERAIYHPGYYGAFVLDPDGNNIEVVNHNRPPG